MGSLWKGLRGNRANSILIVLAMALGMAAVTLVYAVMDAVLLRPLPYARAERLSMIWTLSEKKAPILSAPARISDFARDAKQWESVSAFYSENMNLVALNGKRLDSPERLQAIRTLPNFAQAIGLVPQLGRAPQGAEEEFGGAKTVIVSHAFWRTWMNQSTDAIGQTLTLNGDTFVVRGVAPAGFRFPGAGTALYVPAQMHPNLLQARGARFVVGVGARRAGVTPEAALSELQSLARAYGQRHGSEEANYSVGTEDPRAYLVGKNTQRSIWLLTAAVLILLCVAAGNAANLMMARGIRRMRGYAMQIALGASQSKILREILLEGLLLSLAGGLAGAFLSWWLLEVVLRYWTVLPTFRDPQLDWRVMAISLGLSAGAGILCSLAPAWKASRIDALEALRAGNRTTGVGSSATWRRALVAGEVALCFLLLSGAMALSQSLNNLEAVSAGFSRPQLLTFGVSIPWETPTWDRISYFQRLRKTFAESPAVKRIALADGRPLDAPMRFQMRSESQVRANLAGTSVSEGYFETLGIPILRGRAFGPEDKPGAERVVILNQSAAQLFFGKEDPIGKLLYQAWNKEERPRKVIGVVADVPFDLRQGSQPMKYETSQDDHWPSPVFFLEPKGSTTAALADLKRRLREADPGRAMHGVESMDAYIDSKKSEPRLHFVLVGIFGGSAALLAFLGLYGVLSWYVAQRSTEIGVRTALGARPFQVVFLVARQGLAPSFAGSLVGLALAVGALRFAKPFLFQADIRFAFLWAGVAILALSLLAMAMPLWRAARINPLDALRNE